MKKYISFLIAFLAIGLCSLSFFTNIDNKINDLFLKASHPLEESDKVYLLMVDDDSVEHVGTWPWNRNIMGDTIVFARELGADSVVFDLSYLDPSSRSADPDYIENELPGYIDSAFESVNETTAQIIGALAEGGEEYSAEDLYSGFEDFSEEVKNQIKTNVSYVVTDNDQYLANCLRFFDNSFLTLDFENRDEQNAGPVSGADIYYLATKIALNNIDASKDTITPEFNSLTPALDVLIKNAKRAGFVNAEPDADGYRRRVHLVYKYDGVYYGQLVFVPLLQKFGNPEVIITDKSITLKDARVSESVTKDIVIPRCEDGSVLVKYPKKDFIDYNYINVWNIYQMKKEEKLLKYNLDELDNAGFFYYMENDDFMTPKDYYDGAMYIRDALLENGENEEDEITYDKYIEFRTKFFESFTEFLHGEYEDRILADIDDEDEEYKEMVQESLADIRINFDKLIDLRKSISAKISGAMLIVGTSATSTTDYAITLYEENYPNVGVHASIANMILAEDFVDDSPWWISVAISLIICIGFCFSSKKLSTGKSLLVGLGIMVVTVMGLWGFFAASKVYIGTFVPVASLFITFVATAVIGFLTASHEKKFIQGAFAQCLSPDVVNDIVSNPDSLKLGGENRDMSAIFTDIQKFSGFSELMNADELVALLNFYLTPMSDIIMEEGGMVDKYEGDAIVALVGAPLKMDDHAARACAAAIKMKKYEKKMNDEIVAYSISDATDIPENLRSAFRKMTSNGRRIFTRIGINSGDMVAGFMGSDKKKNYTMMGNNVNLASRLEGVNKQYSTGGILISEATRNLIGDKFVVRSLDRVQVVNVKTPMRLYELMETAEAADEKLVKYVEYWEQAMKVFESGNYEKALEMFKKCTQAKIDDNVAKYYVQLIEKFFIHGKYPTLEDDFGVAYNPENPEDMDPSWIGTGKEIKGTFTLLNK